MSEQKESQNTRGSSIVMPAFRLSQSSAASLRELIAASDKSYSDTMREAVAQYLYLEQERK